MKKAMLFILVLLFLGCTTEVEYVPIPQRPVPAELMSPKENAMIVLTNQSRVELGLKKYNTSLTLYYLAKDRVSTISESQELSHVGWYDAYLQSGAIYYGESISQGYVSPESNVQAFRISADHWPMFVSPIYEYIAIACQGDYTVVLVARWRTYNGKKALEIKEVGAGNVSTITIQ